MRHQDKIQAIRDRNYKKLFELETCQEKRKMLMQIFFESDRQAERIKKMNNREYERYLQRELKRG